jgi:hypothetical protein
MAIGRREKICSVSGIVLIALSILIIVALTGGSDTAGKLSFQLTSRVVPYFNALAWIVPIGGGN